MLFLGLAGIINRYGPDVFTEQRDDGEEHVPHEDSNMSAAYVVVKLARSLRRVQLDRERLRQTGHHQQDGAKRHDIGDLLTLEILLSSGRHREHGDADRALIMPDGVIHGTCLVDGSP